MSASHKQKIVTNLRRIWNVRKKEMEITQVEAAKKLNWTQGAFSQYLNAITEMSPTTIIKLANFLDVDPTEIDPLILQSLPNVHKTPIVFAVDNPNQKLNKTALWDAKPNDFCIEVNESCHLQVDGGIGERWQMLKGMMFICLDYNTEKDKYYPRMSSNTLYFLVQKKNSDVFEIFTEPRLPPKTKINKQFLITDLAMY
tara:strand:+ start:1262 stop:1858 length:597 start_codon:yes stop_codon:yes gene_type:complete